MLEPGKGSAEAWVRHSRSAIIFGTLKDCRRIPTRHDRCPKLFL